MPREFDSERISAILSDIDRYHCDLRELHISAVEDLNDKRTFYAASMILFALLNRTIDLGNEILITRGFRIPSTYREIFVILGQEQVIDTDLAGKIGSLVFYRNLLSHEYHGINPEKLFILTGRVSDILAFTRKIQQYLLKG